MMPRSVRLAGAFAAVLLAQPLLAATPKAFPLYVNVPKGAYFDTDVKPDRTTVVEADFQTADTANEKTVFGVTGAGFNFACQPRKTAGTSITPWLGTGSGSAVTPTYPFGRSIPDLRRLVRLSKDGLVYDGCFAWDGSTCDSTAVSTNPLRIFAIYGSGGSFIGKAYRLTVWHGGALVRNYLPCIDADDVACFYDTVAGACVYSASATAFTAPTEATEGDWRVQDSVLQVRVKVTDAESAGRISLDGGTPAQTVEKWVVPGTAVTLAASTADDRSAVFLRWPERIPTATPTNATVTVTADYPIVVTNRVFARVNDYVNATGGNKNFNTSADWRSGAYPAVDIVETNVSAWVRTADIMYLTNAVTSVSWPSMTSDMRKTDDPTKKKYPPFNVGWKLGTVVGDPYHTLGGIVADCYRTYLFEDAGRFQGYVRNDLGSSRAAWHGPILHVRAGWTNELPQFYAMGLSYLLATSDGAGGFARAHRLFGSGVFYVGRTSSNYNSAGSKFLLDHLEFGSEGLMFVGADAPIDIRGKLWDSPAIAPGAALHLDASIASTRTVTDGNVTEWRDADGGTVVATKIGTGSITIGTSTNGLDVFSCANKAAFQLSRTLAAKELFIVFRDLTGYTSAPPWLVGDEAGATAWQRNTTAGYLFKRSKDCSGYSKELDAGETWLDGRRLEMNASEDFRHTLHVVAGGLCAGTSDITYIGAKTASANVGNLEIAEVLVYEKTLTPRERQQTCDALRRKWQWKTFSKDWDLGVAVVTTTTGGSGTLAFTEGRTAVRELKYPNGTKTFTKHGAGTLEVGRLLPDGQNVTVADGRFAVRGLSAPVKNEKASDPCVWLDASQVNSLVPDPADSSLVCRWNDMRGQNEYGQTIYATNRPCNGVYGRSPMKISDTPTGLTALDLGPVVAASKWKTGEQGDSGVFEIKNGRLREAFFVVKHTADAFLLVANGNWDYFGGKSSCFVNDSYGAGAIVGGHWTLNGETVSSHNASTTIGTWYVIGFKALQLYTNLNYLGQGRGNQDSTGGVAYGEILYYDRILTDEERRNTEAYLMKKWLDKDHPAKNANAPTFATMSFAAGVTNVVESDADLTVRSVVASSGSFVKKGDGAVTVGGVGKALTDVSVEGGSLTVALSNAVDIIAHSAYLRFDASRPATFTTYQKDGTTYVSKVTHPLGDTGHAVANRGVYLRDNQVGSYTKTNAMFLSQVEIGGKERAVFDFGEYCMATNLTGTTCIDVVGNAAHMTCPWTSLKEAYVVMRERPAAKGKAPIISCWPYTFDRNGEKTICGWWCGVVRDGDGKPYDYWMDIDGTTVNKDSEYPEGWHLFSMSTPGTLTVPSWGGSFVKDKNWMHLGGQQVAEFIGFTATNTPAVRAAIRDYLRAKWFGTPTTPLETLHVASGASAALTVTDGSTLAVKSLSGGGALTASICDLAALSVDVRGKDDVVGTTVAGSVSFADAVAVTLNIADPALRLTKGRYPILTATSLGQTDLANWTVQPTRLNRRNFFLEREGETIYLKVIPDGLTLYIH